jgi:ABC-type uncharacterized transport system permease subunit
MNKDFSKLCTPAKLYFAIAVLACIIALFNGLGVVAVLVKLIFAFIWTFVLGFLCSKGYQSLSWFLVLLPYIVILLAMIGFLRLSKSNRAFLNNIKLQGVLGKEYFTNKQ